MRKLTVETLAILGALVVAVAASEATIRLLLPTGLDMRSQFRPGPYALDADPKVRITFGWEGFDGFLKIHNADLVHRLRIGQYGFRNIVATPGPGPYDDVFIVGGASQTFGHGLVAENTWPANLARQSCWPIRVFNGVMPGMGTAYTYFLYKKRLGADFRPKVVILVNYGTIKPGYGLSLFENAPPEKFPKDFAGFFSDTWVIDGWPRRVTIKGMPFLDHSKVFRRIADRVKKTREEIAGILDKGPERLSSRLRRLVRAASGMPLVQTYIDFAGLTQPAADEPVAAPPADPREQFRLRSAANYRRYLDYLQRDLAPHGAKVLVLNLPLSINHRDPYVDVRAETPPDIPLLDPQPEYFDWRPTKLMLPDSHFGPEITRWIGKRVADELCRLKKEGKLD